MADGYSQKKRLCLSRKRNRESSTRVVHRETCVDIDLSKPLSDEIVSVSSSSAHRPSNVPTLVSTTLPQTAGTSTSTESVDSKSLTDCHSISSATSTFCVSRQPVACWQKPLLRTTTCINAITSQTKLSQFFSMSRQSAEQYSE